MGHFNKLHSATKCYVSQFFETSVAARYSTVMIPESLGSMLPHRIVHHRILRLYKIIREL